MAYSQDLVRFGKNMKSLRIEQKWTPAGLGRHLGISADEIMAIERGSNTNLQLYLACAIAQKLKVSLDHLLRVIP